MSLSDSFIQGLSAPVPVAGAGLPDDLTLYAGGPLDPLKQHEEKYKQLAHRQRMSDRESSKMLAALADAENDYGSLGSQEEDMGKVGFISSNPVLRRQYLMKVARGLEPPLGTQEVEAPSSFQAPEPAVQPAPEAWGPTDSYDFSDLGKGLEGRPEPSKMTQAEWDDVLTAPYTPEQVRGQSTPAERKSMVEYNNEQKALEQDYRHEQNAREQRHKEMWSEGRRDDRGRHIYAPGLTPGQFENRHPENWRTPEQIKAHPSIHQQDIQDWEKEEASRERFKRFKAQYQLESEPENLPYQYGRLKGLNVRGDSESASGLNPSLPPPASVRHRNFIEENEDILKRIEVLRKNRGYIAPEDFQAKSTEGFMEGSGYTPEETQDYIIDKALKENPLPEGLSEDQKAKHLLGGFDKTLPSMLEATQPYGATPSRMVQRSLGELQRENRERREQSLVQRDERLEAKREGLAGPPLTPIRAQQDQARAGQGLTRMVDPVTDKELPAPQPQNNAYRITQALRDLNKAYEHQQTFDPSGSAPTTPQQPVEEPGFWDRTKGFFSDAGDSLKGMGSRVIRQGTQGLQQAANYGLRNVDWLEGMVDDDEEARILTSLAQGSTGADREYYLNQLREFTDKGKDYRGRDASQQARMEALAPQEAGGGVNYKALRNMHLEEQARKRYGSDADITPEILAEMDKDYGQAFDMYYGRGDEAQRLGINPLEEDSFGAMYGDTKERFNAFRRAKQQRDPASQVATDPKQVMTTQGIRAAENLEGISTDTRSWLSDNFREVQNIDDPVELGAALESALDFGDPRAVQALEYIGADLPPEKMTRVLMTAMPQALSMGEALSDMSDEEAIQYLESMPPDYLNQLDRFIALTSRHIAPKMPGVAEEAPPTTSPVQEATDEEIAQHGGLLDRAMSWVPGVNQYYDRRLQDASGVDKIDTEFLGTGIGSGEGTWHRVPGQDNIGSSLFFNPQTGKFNREWLPSRGRMNATDLPPRYQEALHRAMQRDSNSILPTMGKFF